MCAGSNLIPSDSLNCGLIVNYITIYDSRKWNKLCSTGLYFNNNRDIQIALSCDRHYCEEYLITSTISYLVIYNNLDHAQFNN